MDFLFFLSFCKISFLEESTRGMTAQKLENYSIIFLCIFLVLSHFEWRNLFFVMD